MANAQVELVQLVAIVGIVVGAIGSVAPVVPGPALIWLSACAWAWADGFVHVGWPTLVLLAALAVAAEVADVALSVWGGRRTGAAWRSIAVSWVAAILAFLALSLPGALAVGVGALVASEAYRFDGDWQRGWQTSRGVLVGYLLSAVVQMVVGFNMVLLFTVQAFGPP